MMNNMLDMSNMVFMNMTFMFNMNNMLDMSYMVFIVILIHQFSQSFGDLN